MIVICQNCGSEFNKKPADIKRTKNNFCSRSCSTTANNKKNPRRMKTKKCELCPNLVYSDRKKCPECVAKFPRSLGDITLKEAIYHKHHKSSAFALVRTRARSVAKKLGWDSCQACGYNKHIEIAHIKPIRDFDENTRLSVINDPSNLLPLCPNCHWEHDNL